jgi:hypothetical protein
MFVNTSATAAGLSGLGLDCSILTQIPSMSDAALALISPATLVALAATCPGDLYQQIEYGNIPQITPGMIASPQTSLQTNKELTQGPDNIANLDANSQTAARITAAINAAEANGTYNPNGNLPVTATDANNAANAAANAAGSVFDFANWISQHMGTIIVIAAVVGGIILLPSILSTAGAVRSASR